MNQVSSLQRIKTISGVKFKSIYTNKSIPIYFIMPIGMTFLLNLVYSNMVEGSLPPVLVALVLNLGVSMNIGMASILVSSTLLAEEKEKNTLRVLMVSSVKSLEFFLGSLIPIILICIAINLILIPSIGIHLNSNQWLVYVIVTSFGTITGAIIGMCFGIFSKDQMAASLINLPLTMALVMLPSFKGLSKTLETICHFLYTGISSNMIEAFSMGKNYQITLENWLVLIIGLILSFVAFIVLYRLNGYEKD